MLPCIATPLSVRTEVPSMEGIQNKHLLPHIETASIEIRKLVTNAVYDETLAMANTDDDDEKLQYETFVKAESNLALAYGIFKLNIETTGKGIVKIKGWDASRSEVLNQNELNNLSSQFRDVALKLLEDYLPAYEDDESTDEDESDDIYYSGDSVMTVI
jgi:hypothetical protein